MTTPTSRLHPELSLGAAELTVSDLGRSLAFYEQVLGMTVLEREDGTARLGTPTRPLLKLTEVPGAAPAPRSSPGLYHFAVLLPTRVDLARWVWHAAGLGLRLGQGDHLVSEAFYLNDPDGHGIEVYRDRPRQEWRWNLDQVEMASDPIDIAGLLAEPGADTPFAGLPEGTVMGHFHLRVTDLAATEAFYRGVLGFDVVARWPGALFVSVGGYHHHLGLNAWQSEGGRPAPETTARLLGVELTLPGAAEVERLAAHLEAAGVPFTRNGSEVTVRDPAGNRLSFGTTA
ncbi:catechol 2,3-dioxygenase [Deinococcus sp. HSC-46F16]|uniref:VOC family protein n=1 Tax=Deinococcus sp. HSC-46F16 TaxID=2910968 RepID=UPI0020A098B8|nr:VOC family protein [Deinococcus sp. HSC-46F16]MCP2014598.1 catechol 2,3-dioxygenase [Deinococcus sp. HSC-46F16]